MKRIDEKIDNYLNEASKLTKEAPIFVKDRDKPVDYWGWKAPCCYNCAFSLEGKKMTCENPSVYKAIAIEYDWPNKDYRGQIDMYVSPGGVCKFFRKGMQGSTLDT